MSGIASLTGGSAPVCAGVVITRPPPPPGPPRSPRACRRRVESTPEPGPRPPRRHGDPSASRPPCRRAARGARRTAPGRRRVDVPSVVVLAHGDRRTLTAPRDQGSNRRSRHPGLVAEHQDKHLGARPPRSAPRRSTRNSPRRNPGSRRLRPRRVHLAPDHVRGAAKGHDQLVEAARPGRLGECGPAAFPSRRAAAAWARPAGGSRRRRAPGP